MPYKKRYNLKELEKIIKELIENGRSYMDFGDLLFEIDFDPLDVNMFWVKNIKFRVRYERERL
jgi:hypothetical protein